MTVAKAAPSDGEREHGDRPDHVVDRARQRGDHGADHRAVEGGGEQAGRAAGGRAGQPPVDQGGGAPQAGALDHDGARQRGRRRPPPTYSPGSTASASPIAVSTAASADQPSSGSATPARRRPARR